VLLQVSVLDGHGVPVRGLAKEDFDVFEDGVRQPIAFFEHHASGEAVPTGIVLLVDTSSSMKGRDLAGAKEAALRFLASTPSHAEVAVAGFDRETRVVQGFTRDRQALAGAVSALDARGGTALYDGILDAIELLHGNDCPRQLLVVLSDGMDLDSESHFETARSRIESSAIVVYTIGYYSEKDRSRYLRSGAHIKNPPVEENLNPAWVLSQISELSGGAAFFPETAEELEPLFERIVREMQLHYLLAYSPSAPAVVGPRFRTIEVQVHRRSRETDPLMVRARRGYVR
jgi:VWFA-related protein